MNMSKGGDSSGDGGDSSSSSAEYLKHLNKISHKISKSVRKPPVYENRSLQAPQFEIRDRQSQPAPAAVEAAHSLLQQHHPAPPQQQPPVYNINKSDFRDVVQKLTGSPAHERISTPPPIQHTKQQSSRLQRIRPPPLAQIGNRPASLIPTNPRPAGVGFVCGQRPAQPQPLSPLPPFPAVHAAAESPISAYMRFLQSSFNGTGLDSKRFSSGPPPHAPLASPRWNGLAPPPLHHQLFPPQQQNIPPPPPASSSSSSAALQPYPAMPSSPLPFSCLPSPRSPCALLSPNLLHSPGGQLGFPQLPLSPTVPLSSPTWKGI